MTVVSKYDKNKCGWGDNNCIFLPVYYYVYYLQYWDNNYNIASFNRLLMDYDISLVDWHTNVLQHCFIGHVNIYKWV